MQLCLILIEKTKEYEGKQISSREYLYFQLYGLLDLQIYHNMSEQCMSGSQQTHEHLSSFTRHSLMAKNNLLFAQNIFCL